MRTIVVQNLKGGVGKTTTVVNLAAILARDYNQRVLVIDADSQCNTTYFFGGDSAQGNLAMALRAEGTESQRVELARGYIQTSECDGVDILPGSDALMDLDLTQLKEQGVNTTIIRDLVRSFPADEPEVGYDWCFVDCPPAFNAACAAALLAADEVMIPIKLEAFALQGMANLMRQIANMRKINKGLKLLGVLPTMWDNHPVTLEAEEQLRRSSVPVLPHIRWTVTVPRSTAAKTPLVSLAHPGAGLRDYRRLAAYLMEGGDSNG